MFLEMTFFSEALKRQTQIYVLLPQQTGEGGAPVKTLWLFHGLSDNHTTWMRRTSIERYAEAHNLAVVMPNVDRSWYTDTAYGANYLTFVSKELPALCFGTFRQLSRKREDNIVAGISMGGYGALKVALTCPEQYSACISLSGGVAITRKRHAFEVNEWKSLFGYDLTAAEELTGTRHDLFALAQAAANEEQPLPKLYLWCGLQDFLLDANLLFDEHLTALGIPHKFETSEGDHSWKWWDLHIQDGLNWVMHE